MDAFVGKKTSTRKIADLKPHPRQAELFGDALDHEILELADSLRRDGLLHPVEILSDGTIISGHRRTAAARAAGWEEIEVWVRDDLAAQGPEAVERRLIEDNLDRRQMGPLAVAKCYRALKLLCRPGRKRLYDAEKEELRDQIGRRLGVSGQTLDRYLRVVEGTPPEVQHAVEANLLPVTTAEKVAGLTKAQREAIAKEIREGGKPAEVLRRYLRPASGRRERAADALGAFLRGLGRGVADLEGRVGKVAIHLGPKEWTLLERAEALIKAVRRQAQESAGNDDAGAAGAAEPLPCHDGEI